MAGRIYHYPLWIRLWHLANALLCLALIISGISMQFSDPERSFMQFDFAVTLHNISAVILTCNYLVFFIANKLTGNSIHYKVSGDKFRNTLVQQFRYYTVGIFKNVTPPYPINSTRKFNPLQQLAYFIVMYILLPLVIISGWAMLFPEVIVGKIFTVSGLFLTDLIHIVTGFIISMFMVIHIYFCMLGTNVSSTFRSIINGWVETH